MGKRRERWNRQRRMEGVWEGKEKELKKETETEEGGEGGRRGVHTCSPHRFPGNTANRLLVHKRKSQRDGWKKLCQQIQTCLGPLRW